MEPLIDPPVPYLGQIKGGFIPGKMVRIQGFASPVGERFDINFQTSANTEPRDDIGLHLSIRLLEGYVARNSIKGGIWGEEQSNGDLPIQPGQKYEIIILSDNAEFKVAINGKHFCEFPQRIPGSYITHLSIEGDTSLSLISFESFNVSNQNVQATSAPTQAVGTPSQYGPPGAASVQSDQGFGPSMGPHGQYGSPGGGYGVPMQGYGPPPGYGPNNQFGPPSYGPPPPPGSEEGKSSGLENFLETAGPVIAGVISSGVADKLLTSISGSGANNPQQPPQQQQYQQPSNTGALGPLGSLLSSFAAPTPPPNTYNASNVGGQGSVGNMGTVGSLLTTFAGQMLQPQNRSNQPQ